MRKITILYALSIVLLCMTANAQESTHEVRRSPDGRFFAGWFDHDAGAPFGLMRAVVVRSATGFYDIFSFVTTPGYTDAAWNPASNQCVVADAPDNGGPKVWLVYQKNPEEWASRELDPFAPLYESFRKIDPEVHWLFRPSILKMVWLSDTTIRFRGFCNTGTYFITVDTSAPDKPPQTQKLSDQLLEE